MLCRRVALLALLLALAPAACGGDDDDSGSSGSGSDYGADYGSDENTGSPAEPEPEPEPEPLEPTAGQCAGDAPQELVAPPGYDGFVRLCRPQFAENLLVVWNISNVVIYVEGDDKDPKLVVWPSEETSLSTRVVSQLGLPDCGDVWCRIPPGGHLRATGLAPVGVILEFDEEMTAAVALSTSVAGALESRLQRAGGRGIRAAAACAEGTGAAISEDNWEASFRHALTAAPSCNAIRRLLFPRTTPESAVNRVLRQAKSLSGGLWVDAFVKGSQLVR